MKYIKYSETEKKFEQAPSVKHLPDGRTIYGYDKPSNREMLLVDGWLEYAGKWPISALKWIDGKIVEPEEPAPAKQTTFTKLQIRRAMRALGCESTLDGILSGVSDFAKDWNDAQDIDLNDPGFIEAIAEWEIPQSFVDQVIEQIISKQL